MSKIYKQSPTSLNSICDTTTGSSSHSSVFSGMEKISLQVSPSEKSDTEKLKPTVNTYRNKYSGGSNIKIPTHKVSYTSFSSAQTTFSSAQTIEKNKKRLKLKVIAKVITEILKLRKSTTLGPKQDKSRIKYENTYKTGPDSGKHFAISRIQKTALEILQIEIGDSKYDGVHAGKLARIIAQKIISKAKDLDVTRYRFVCKVLLTDVRSQGMQTASRCLWEQSTDNFTSVTYKNNSICATAMIFGIYLA